MAEIKIEKRSPVWPWILLIVIVVGVLIYVFASDRDDDTIREGAGGTTGEPASMLPVAPDNSPLVALIPSIKDGRCQIVLSQG